MQPTLFSRMMRLQSADATVYNNTCSIWMVWVLVSCSVKCWVTCCMWGRRFLPCVSNCLNSTRARVANLIYSTPRPQTYCSCVFWSNMLSLKQCAAISCSNLLYKLWSSDSWNQQPCSCEDDFRMVCLQWPKSRNWQSWKKCILREHISLSLQ